MPETAPRTTNAHVLLVEDDEEVSRTICNGLAAHGFGVERASSLAVSKRLLTSKRFDAVVLDLTLPDGDGLELSSQLRAAGAELPILMLTARDSVPDRLVGFEHGADDYVGKPFDVDELAARLRVILRRARASERHLLRYADIELDLLTRTARRKHLEATLSDRETALLAFLLRNPEQILSREGILEEVWGDEVEVDSNVLNVFINLLRNKVDSSPQARLIRSVRGVGYMLSEKEPEELS
ncbi:MAG: response regulator transcription factor [Phycisphaerales bacterium]|nr:MAG: response regulator transcription factor [Phycisphaerales bacterium]